MRIKNTNESATGQITLTLRIDPATAARAGKARVGEISVVLGDEDLSALTETQRETLARHVGQRSGGWEVQAYTEPLCRHAEPIAEATIEVVASLLDQRAAYIESVRAKREAESEADHQALADRLAELREEPIKRLFDYRGEHGLQIHTFLYGGASNALPTNDRTTPAHIYLGREEEGERYLAERKAAEIKREAEAEAAEAAKAAKAEADRKAMGGLLDLVAPNCTPRWRDGWLPTDELDAALEPLLPDYGLAAVDADRYVLYRQRPDSLTEREYAAWTRIANASKMDVLRDGTVVEVSRELHKIETYRSATEDEIEAGEADRDGEVLDGPRPVVSISAEIHGVPVETTRFLLRE